jgi:hypothetical protein
VNKVIYISHVKYSKKLSRDWYIDDFLLVNKIVEFWDLTEFLFGNLEEPNEVTATFINKLSTITEFSQKLKLEENQKAIYVVLINYEVRFLDVYRQLTSNNCKIVFMAWGAYPSRRSLDFEVFKKKLFNPFFLFKNLYWRFKSWWYIKTGQVKPYDIVFGAGSVIMQKFSSVPQLIHTNLPDYDHFLAAINTPAIIKKKYAVFLDVYLPYHSDIKILGYKPIDAGQYYSSLNRFFDILERRLNVEIVIAAHPKANYGQDHFNGRKIYVNLTPILVKSAEFVLSHHSTSISYAVLNYKPIIFIYTEEMKRVYNSTLVKLIKNFATFLEVPVLNIDMIAEYDEILVDEINIEKYEMYKYNFVVSKQSENQTSKEIFLREMMRL